MKEIQETNFLEIEEPLALTLSVINGISSVLGTAGNVALIAIIFFHRHLRGASEMLLLSLALADLLSCAVYLPLLIIRLNTTQKLPTVMNQIRRAVGQATASLNLVMLTADQFIFFYRPLRYLSWMRKKVAMAIIIFIHVIATSCGVFAFYDMEKSQYFKTGVIGAAILAFFCLHYAIYRLATGQRNKVTNQQISLQHNYHVTDGAMLRAKRNLRTVMLIGILYFVTWLPVTIFQLWNSITMHNNTSTFQKYFYVLSTVQQISSLVDPFLYCFRNSKVRKVFLKIFPQKRNHVSSIIGHSGQAMSSRRTSKANVSSPTNTTTTARPSIICDNANNQICTA